MKEYWSKRIQNIKPYTPGEQPKNRKFIKLNTNESPFGPSIKVKKAIIEAVDDTLRLYPDPDCTSLRTAIAKRNALDLNQVFVGNGSDEILSMAFEAFFSEGDTILFPDVTYSFYPVYAEFLGIRYNTIPLNEDFTIDPDKYCNRNQGIVIANPNAPTGIALPLRDIEKICASNPDAVVIVDEAYIDFGAESAVPLIHKYSNLLIVQTFSKSRNLAGLRVGFAMGTPNLIQALNATKNSINSYTLDRLALAGAEAAIEDENYFQQCRRNIIENRNKTILELQKLGCTVLDSKANFIFVKHEYKEGAELFRELREKGILVRYFSQERTKDFIRVSIGTENDMKEFVQAMSEIIIK